MYFNETINPMVIEKEKPRLTTCDMAEKIEKALYETEFLLDELKRADYISYWEAERDPHTLAEHPHSKYWYQDVRAIVSTGGSEGVYVDAYVRRMYEGNKKEIEEFPLMTVKTLGSGLEDYASMGRIAGAITYLGELYLTLNRSLIKENENETGGEKSDY